MTNIILAIKVINNLKGVKHRTKTTFVTLSTENVKISVAQNLIVCYLVVLELQEIYNLNQIIE